MARRSHFRLHAMVVIGLVFAGHAAAQFQRSERQREEYIPLRFDSKIGDSLKFQLEFAEKNPELANFAANLLKNPELLKSLQGMLKDRPDFSEILKKAESLRGQNGAAIVDEIKKLQDKGIDPKLIDVEAIRNAAKDNENIRREPSSNIEVDPKKNTIQQEKTPQVDQQAAKQMRETDAKIREWTSGFIERLKDSKVGNQIANSPAIQNALEELAKGTSSAGLPANKWTQWADKIDWTSKLNNAGNAVTKELRKIDWSRFRRNFNLPNMPRMNVRLPALGAPRPIPVAPSLDYGTPALMLLACLAVAATAWLLWTPLRTRKRKKAKTIESLGDWPVAPAEIRTKADVIRAFEYLAVLKLGFEARPFNHRQIVERFKAQFKNDGVKMAVLAEIYQMVRYDGAAPDQLSPDQAEQSRRCLTQLAEAA